MPFRDAESWLAERGVERDPLRVEPPQTDQSPAGHRPAGGGSPTPPPPGAADAEDRAPIERADGADGAEAAVAAEADQVDEPEDPAEVPDEVDDDPATAEEVGEALAYARRATSATPLSEGRLREKLADRGYDEDVIARVMVRCRDEALVDDELFAAALVDEGKRKGHAPLRIRTDLEKRGFDEEVIAVALAEADDTDPEAAAFAVARERAARLRGVATETAYRRLVGYLQRRGYTDALSRKVAREAVFTDREPERTATR